jgi:hypothetical protein
MARDEPAVRVWVRAVWRLPTGGDAAQRAPARTVKRAIEGDPEDTERRAIELWEFVEEWRATGH